MKRALIVRQPYADLIITGEKVLEMRSRHTSVRERVGIIPQGSGKIIGSVEITDSFDFTLQRSVLKSRTGQMFHCVEPQNWDLLDKWCFGWQLDSPTPFDKPIPYKHPKGAVTWVLVSH